MLALGLGGCDPAPDPGIAGRPDVLLVTLDTVRADHLGAYGGDAALSPTFDGLAARGVLYLQATSPAPLTLPAHASLLTGRDPPFHGLRLNGRGRLPDDMPTLAERFRDGGYRTAAFVSSRVLHPRHGLDRGFDLYDAPGRAERDAAATVDRARRWLAESGDTTPRFLWVHLYDPHAPYRPPAPYERLYRTRPYDGELAFMDAEVGRLLDAFEPAIRGVLPPAGDRPPSFVVALVGDHGEGLGDHGESEHGLLLYQSTLHVPLVFHAGHLPGGRVIDTAVSTTRVPATLCRLAGISPAGGMEGALLLDEETDTEPRPVYSEALLGWADYGWSPLVAWREGRWKLIDGAFAAVHDLQTDPGESVDQLARAGGADGKARGGTDESPLSRLRAHLDAFRRRIPAPRTAGSPAVDADTLRTLGYLGGGGLADHDVRERPDPRDQVAFHEQVAAVLTRLRDGEHAAAAAGLQGLLATQPHNPFLLDLAGSVEMLAGDPDAAIVFFQRALTAGGERPALRLRLAEALLAAGLAQAAESAARRAWRADADTEGRAPLVLGQALNALGRRQEALDVVREALVSLRQDARYREALERLAGGEAAVDTGMEADLPPRRW